jgi:hypothetical protein
MSLREYVGIARVANNFVPFYVNGTKKTFIANSETDIRVAKAAAEVFAAQKNIPLSSVLHTIQPALLTVFESEGKWYPAELHPDRITLLSSLGPIDLCGPQEHAIRCTKLIAQMRGADFVPSSDCEPLASQE